MTPSELRSLLEERGIRPLKARGQHFLLDIAVVDAMVDAAAVSAGDRVVEFGPGPGILTEALLARGAEVVAVELDARLASLVEERFADAAVRVVRGDLRRTANRDLLAMFRTRGDYKVVANLPYGVTTDALLKIVREEPRPTSATVMVQREVADRLCAEPPAMSAIAVTVRTFATVSKVRNVPAGSFLPPPKVDSAVIHIDCSRPRVAPGTDTDLLLRLAHAAFAAKRRQVRNSLSRLVPKERLEHAFVDAKIVGSARPEELRVRDWERLVVALTQQP